MNKKYENKELYIVYRSGKSVILSNVKNFTIKDNLLECVSYSKENDEFLYIININEILTIHCIPNNKSGSLYIINGKPFGFQ